MSVWMILQDYSEKAGYGRDSGGVLKYVHALQDDRGRFQRLWKEVGHFGEIWNHLEQYNPDLLEELKERFDDLP